MYYSIENDHKSLELRIDLTTVIKKNKWILVYIWYLLIIHSIIILHDRFHKEKSLDPVIVGI